MPERQARNSPSLLVIAPSPAHLLRPHAIEAREVSSFCVNHLQIAVNNPLPDNGGCQICGLLNDIVDAWLTRERTLRPGREREPASSQYERQIVHLAPRSAHVTGCRVEAGCCQARPPLRTVRESFPSFM